MRWTSIPSRGVEILLATSCCETRISFGPMSQLAQKASLHSPYWRVPLEMELLGIWFAGPTKMIRKKEKEPTDPLKVASFWHKQNNKLYHHCSSYNNIFTAKHCNPHLNKNSYTRKSAIVVMIRWLQVSTESVC